MRFKKAPQKTLPHVRTVTKNEMNSIIVEADVTPAEIILKSTIILEISEAKGLVQY